MGLALSIAAVVAPFVAAGLASVGVRSGIRQRDDADGRAEWWQRFRTAVEWSTSHNEIAIVAGIAVLSYLVDGPPIAKSDETALVEKVSVDLMLELEYGYRGAEEAGGDD